jgi:hypothetical protein
MIVDAFWYMPNIIIQSDFQIPTVKEEIAATALNILLAHPNNLIVNLTELSDNRRLRRHLPNDLPPRFLV